MKFTPPENFRKWTFEETETRLNIIRDDAANLNREMNTIDKRINILNEQKRQVRIKIANKNRYISQLKIQLKDPYTHTQSEINGLDNWVN